MFTRINRFIWACGNNKNIIQTDGLLVEKTLSTLLHLVGVHTWHEGKFVEIYHALVGPYNFKENIINDIWMRNHLQCEHDVLEVREPIDPTNQDYILLLDDICSNNRLKQLLKAAHVISTSKLEAYHSLALNYRPKRHIL